MRGSKVVEIWPVSVVPLALSVDQMAVTQV